MTRGKYASRAESRQARESAVAALADLRRAHERLVNDHEDLVARHKKLTTQHIEQVSALRRQLADGTSGEVEELRGQIVALNARIEGEFERLRERVFKAIRDNPLSLEVTLPHGVEILAHAFDVTPGELMSRATASTNRSVRRTTVKRANRIGAWEDEMRAIGVSPEGL